MESIFGGLIEFKSKDELNSFLESIDKDNALKVIEKQIEYIQQEGGYTLLEATTLHKCLTKLKENV